MYYQRVRPFREWPVPNVFRDMYPQDEQEIECSGSWIPKVDVEETKDAIVLYAELPGMSREDIKLSIRDKVLEISGTKTFSDVQKNERLHRSERTFGEFCRKFALPTDIEVKNISARFKDGVLKLTLPKAERVKAKEIEIKTE